MRVFLTCSTYALGKELGIREAAEQFLAQCEGDAEPLLPAARFARRLGNVADVELCHLSSTTLPIMRSRAAWAAYKSAADVWVTVDDDVEADTGTIRRMLTASLANNAAGFHAVLALPCRVRGIESEQLQVNVRFATELISTFDGQEYRRATHAGTGCMFVSRLALDRLVDAYSESLAFRDEADGETKPALFEMLRELGGPWYSEDYSFSIRCARANVPIYAPVSGVSSHDGLALDLSRMRDLPAVT